MKTVGNKLKLLREKAQLSLRELGEKTGLSASFISNWNSDRYPLLWHPWKTLLSPLM